MYGNISPTTTIVVVIKIVSSHSKAGINVTSMIDNNTISAIETCLVPFVYNIIINLSSVVFTCNFMGGYLLSIIASLQDFNFPSNSFIIRFSTITCEM